MFDEADTLTKINVQVTVKAKALSCWIFENVPKENWSLLTEKKTKSLRQNESENPARKEQRTGKIERARRKKGGEGKEAVAALLVFMLTSLEIVFERKKLFDGRSLFFLPLRLTEI